MKLYIAGLYAVGFDFHGRMYLESNQREQQARQGVEHKLESYHYVGKQSIVDKMRRDGVKVFLDSGAFSSFTKGAIIDLAAYCDYIKRNEDLIHHDDGIMCASVLDGIGDALLTYQNQRAMEQRGVKPLPCFHYGEDERYLEWYVAHYDYITLGGTALASGPQLVNWFDRIWNDYLCDSTGRPKVKVHGFAVTSLKLMARYPWYSVDSATWVQRSMNGEIMLPGYGVISLSNRSPSRKIAGRHLSNYDDETAKVIRDNIEWSGFDLSRLEDSIYPRMAFNMWSFPIEGNRIEKHSFKNPQMEIF